MAAKLLHSLADDNPDLQKQIGCMTGIFQIFDRQQIGRRVGPSHKRLLPPTQGNVQFSNGDLDADYSNAYNREGITEGNLNRLTNDKQRRSTESSRPSFSSSSRSSSFSSLDCGRTAQPEPSSVDRIIFHEMSSRDPVTGQTSASPRLGRQSVDLRDVVKDSMYRETRGLAVHTMTKEGSGNGSKHRDSPRPLQLSESFDGSMGVNMNGKQELPADFEESLRVLAKLREAPWYNNEKDYSRLSYDTKDGSSLSTSKDGRRYSFDGQEVNRLSFDLRDTVKSRTKDMPRFSLDSREKSSRVSNFDSKIMHLSRNTQRGTVGSADKVLDPQQSSPNHNRSTSVVARLMGLDALPDAKSSGENRLGPIKTYSLESCGPPSLPLKKPDVRPIRLPKYPRTSRKEPTSPRWRNTDGVMRPTSASKFPMEPAPWKHQDACRSPHKQTAHPVKSSVSTSSSSPSVFGEIEKRLKDLEFKQAGKDLRALKQIVEAMQAKGFLESPKEEHIIDVRMEREEEGGSDVNGRFSSPLERQTYRTGPSTVGTSNSSRPFESPIVIMKPAKLIQKSGIPASSIVPTDSLPDLQRAHSNNNSSQGKNSSGRRAPRDRSPKDSRVRVQPAVSTDRKSGNRNSRVAQSPIRIQQANKDSPASTLKNSGSTSPRLQRKLEFGRRSRPPTPPPSDTNKPRRHPNRQSTETSSPDGRRRTKLTNAQQSCDQSSETGTESRHLSGQGDDDSVHSDASVNFESRTDVEVESTSQSVEMTVCQSSSSEAFKCSLPEEAQKDACLKLTENFAVEELGGIAPDQPSPVSVLDSSVYREGSLSPVNQTLHEHQDATEDDATNVKNDPDEERWVTEENDIPSTKPFTEPCTTTSTEMNRKKLQDIDNLVEKLRRLNSNHDEARIDYIASLCENTTPDHRYVSEMLLASGLLLRDLSSGIAAIQLHASGHPINPELFFVLEQTKFSSSLHLKEDCESDDKAAYMKAVVEKFHRKLLFDTVNELLVGKLQALISPSLEQPWLKPNKLAKKTLNAQKLLRELCGEIEELQAKNREEFTLEEEEYSLKGVLWEDVMRRSDRWTEFNGEVSGMVLDIERSIFKDLVDEIVLGEAASCRRGGLGNKHNNGRRRRQLFAKQY